MRMSFDEIFDETSDETSYRARKTSNFFQRSEEIHLLHPETQSFRQVHRSYSKYIAIVVFLFVLFLVYHVNPFRELTPAIKKPLDWVKPLLPSTHSTNILIIGAGPAGVSTAWAISQEAKEQKLKIEITVIEQKSGVGGRLQISKPLHIASTSIPVHIEDVATGKLWDKKFARQAKDLFNIEPCVGKQHTNDVGFWNGERLVEKLKEPINSLSWFTWFKLNFKYGLFWNRSIQKLKFLGKLDEESSTKLGVDGMAQFLETSKLAALVDTNAYNYITDILKISKKYVHDVLEPQVRRQLGGQNLAELHLLAVSRALNIEDAQKCSGGGLYQRVLEEYLNRSSVDLKLNSKVLALEQTIQKGKFAWKAHYESHENGVKTQLFDHIIVTGPSNLTDLVKNIEHEHEQEQNIEYKSTWLTYFVSKTNSCITKTLTPVPEEIFPIHDPHLSEDLHDINEISHVQNFRAEDLDNTTSRCIYKILSNNQISNFTLSYAAKYGFVKLQEFKIEKAYPLLYKRRVEYGSFKIQRGLWYTSVVELAGSDASLSWAAGEIVGRLILENQ